MSKESRTPSKLEKILAAGHFGVTSECGPPRGSDPEAISEKAALIRNHVDAVNITDNQTSVCRMCSLAACIRLKTLGVEPVLQMVTRDRNRIALQSDILGAASWDINNILCLSGDHQSFGDHAKGQNVHDLDSMQLLQTVRLMRDEGKFLGGDEIKRPPKMFVGAAANPFADPYEIRVSRLAKKVAAGAEFIQTQCIYNMEKFEDWMKQIVDRGLHEKVYIMAGLTPMKSVGMARYMKNRVPGMDVPDAIVKRLADTPKEKQAEEGIKICIEQIQRLKEVKGVAGFHIMAIEWEEKVPEIVEAAGLYPRPEV
ncbi:MULTISPECIES: methylenetetrahydrofolate reductase [Desulfococcus]|uniref:Methylenetetrahydrofolate reductase n=1 Tax=Desulfococcus multivorans DSM 2059 TaxID=1121405 RepID=S7TMC3_DESML|nr:methylenetetrahydrofolate reductase [Desulfococcus multivorans]AOY59653.1 MetF2: methylenetetrahydrofolate reductase [Desulfococcus multivorans]AQV01838.1 5,10-methylenetetrahydrofolate reductase [Desulfococcus multivorans]EPR37860.1 methylenetetrahydrofolate reductase [Desulfococcus multivorans DSM 2059]SKA16485.1 5,10-methylenetetrahydrofolate reductase (ferredoxin) [Desulfococcus multivorans DSM 2059]